VTFALFVSHITYLERVSLLKHENVALGMGEIPNSSSSLLGNGTLPRILLSLGSLATVRLTARGA
jgi:hypothetical protein